MFGSRVALGLLVLLALLAGPLVAQDEPVTLIVWDHLGDTAGADAPDPIQAIYDEFMVQNPNITIQREVIQAQEMENVVPTALASGEGPDVVYYDLTPARNLFRGGLLLPLDSYAEEYSWFDKLAESGLQWVTFDDQLAGMPIESEFVGVFVNNDIFEAEGWTVPTNLEETLAYCRAASEAGYVPFAHGQNPGWQNFFSFTMPLHNTVGSEWVAARVFDDVGTWEDPGAVQALTFFYRDMRDANCFDPDVNGIDWQTQQDLFYSGEAPLFPTGTWVVGEIDNQMADANVTMMPFPEMAEGMPRTFTVGMGSAWFINADSANPDAAAKLLDFIISDFAIQQLVEVAGFVPPVEFDTEVFDLTPLKTFVVETLSGTNEAAQEYAFGYNVDVLAPLEFNTVLQRGLQQLMADEKTPEQVAAELEQAWVENR